MKRTKIKSSTLRSAGFNIEEKMLELEFTSGAVYQYFDVPEGIFEKLMAADSKGGNFNDSIKYEYSCVQVKW